jgi:pSer/pThr/pTyr-binding forkhead associated (FHA) protein
MSASISITDKNKTFELEVTEQEIILGRSKSCTAALDDGRISGKHCSISLKNNTVIVKDLNSTNGTSINGSKITESELHLEDVLKIGDITIKLLQASEESELDITIPDEPNVQPSNEGNIIIPDDDLSSPSVSIHNTPGLFKSKTQKKTATGRDYLEFEMGQSSGQTKHIQIEKRPKAKLAEREAQHKKNEANKKKSSIGAKIASFFSKFSSKDDDDDDEDE